MLLLLLANCGHHCTLQVFYDAYLFTDRSLGSFSGSGSAIRCQGRLSKPTAPLHTNAGVCDQLHGPHGLLVGLLVMPLTLSHSPIRCLRLVVTKINTDSVVKDALMHWNGILSEHITWTWEVAQRVVQFGSDLILAWLAGVSILEPVDDCRVHGRDS